MGASGCGKTSFGEALKGSADVRFATPEDMVLQRRTVPTIGMDFIIFNAVVSSGGAASGSQAATPPTVLKMQIWDTAGMERYYSFATNAIKRSSALFLFFDVTNRKSFEDLDRLWLPMARDHRDSVMSTSWSSVMLVLIASKIDLAGRRVVSQKEAVEFAECHQMQYFETTALNAATVHTTVQSVAVQLYDLQRKEQTLSRDDAPEGIAPLVQRRRSTTTFSGKRLGTQECKC
jgi:GTPase SAR1 family protein